MTESVDVAVINLIKVKYQLVRSSKLWVQKWSATICSSPKRMRSLCRFLPERQVFGDFSSKRMRLCRDSSVNGRFPAISHYREWFYNFQRRFASTRHIHFLKRTITIKFPISTSDAFRHFHEKMGVERTNSVPNKNTYQKYHEFEGNVSARPWWCRDELCGLLAIVHRTNNKIMRWLHIIPPLQPVASHTHAAFRSPRVRGEPANCRRVDGPSNSTRFRVINNTQRLVLHWPSFILAYCLSRSYRV